MRAYPGQTASLTWVCAFLVIPLVQVRNVGNLRISTLLRLYEHHYDPL